MEILSINEPEDGSCLMEINLNEKEHDVLLIKGLRVFIEQENIPVKLIMIEKDSPVIENMKTFEIEKYSQFLIELAINNILKRYIEKIEKTT